jgi:hypothetical protein
MYEDEGLGIEKRSSVELLPIQGSRLTEPLQQTPSNAAKKKKRGGRRTRVREEGRRRIGGRDVPEHGFGERGKLLMQLSEFERALFGIEEQLGNGVDELLLVRRE